MRSFHLGDVGGIAWTPAFAGVTRIGAFALGWWDDLLGRCTGESHSGQAESKMVPLENRRAAYVST